MDHGFYFPQGGYPSTADEPADPYHEDPAGIASPAPPGSAGLFTAKNNRENNSKK